MKTPPESLKALCDRIASAAVSPGGAELARLLRLAGLLGEPFPPAREAVKPAPASADRVGIWERDSRNGETAFVRRRDRVQEWNYWASLGRIEAKGAKRRVVLIGESAARGYLYDPLFTPAAVLQAILERQPQLRTSGGVEVIDLARTDLGFEVADLAASALLLEPDAVVIFSGNNWNVSGAGMAEGIAGLKRCAEEQLAARVRGLVREVSSLYRDKGIPLVWLVPEFNLGDWRDPFTNAPHLPGNGNRDWLESWQAARQAFDGGDLQQAMEQARKMVEIDQGVCVAGLYLLAECSLRAGDEEAARRFLERARDAVIWDSSRNIAPRCYGVAQDALRGEAAAQGSLLVDLPQVFREHLGKAIPDRRLFLDYCHLTAAGIQVAMAAAASPVLRALLGEAAPWRDLVDESLAPSGEVEAHAAFLAAVHNAHWWQSGEVVRHACSVAARASPAIVPVMERFIEIQTRRTPMLMSQAAEEIAALAERQLQYYLLRYNYQQLDRVLIDAITGALLEIGVDPRERLAELRREEHGLSSRNGGTADLLDYYSCSAALQPQEAMWVLPREVAVREKRSDFYKAYWIESRFLFIAEAGRPVRLSLTCRLPGGTPSRASRGDLLLTLNGRPQAQIAIGSAWETWDVEVPGEAVAEGVNEIAVRWPLPEFPGEPALRSVPGDLSGAAGDRSLPELFPCFGEIHAFTAEASTCVGW
jgi:hypothetical protein